MMRRIGVICISVCVLCTSCGVIRRMVAPLPPPEAQQQDSTVIKEVILYRDSTVFYEVIDSLTVAATRDTSSHIETDMAESDAVIRDGMLHHSLRNKAGLRPVNISIPVKTTQQYRTRIETRYVNVPADLTGWQKARIYMGEVLMGLLFGFIVWLIIKVFRKIGC